MHCGLLDQPGKTYYLALVDNVNTSQTIDPEREIGLNEWLDTDDPQENYFCLACLNERT